MTDTCQLDHDKMLRKMFASRKPKKRTRNSRRRAKQYEPWWRAVLLAVKREDGDKIALLRWEPTWERVENLSPQLQVQAEDMFRDEADSNVIDVASILLSLRDAGEYADWR